MCVPADLQAGVEVPEIPGFMGAGVGFRLSAIGFRPSAVGYQLSDKIRWVSAVEPGS